MSETISPVPYTGNKGCMTYMERFKEPEQISQAEVESDMGFTIISFN